MNTTPRGEGVICPNCNKPAPWVENKAKYGRNYGTSYMCYFCKECRYYVGCHNNTRKPLGTMISDEHCKYRKAVHNKIDPLWQTGKIARKHLYSRLSKILGYTYHTGESDMETCKKVLEIDDKLLTCSKEEFNSLLIPIK